MAAAQALSLAGQAVLAGFAGSGEKGMETAVVRFVCTSKLSMMIRIKRTIIRLCFKSW